MPLHMALPWVPQAIERREAVAFVSSLIERLWRSLKYEAPAGAAFPFHFHWRADFALLTGIMINAHNVRMTYM
jgi:hypothetical protein